MLCKINLKLINCDWSSDLHSDCIIIMPQGHFVFYCIFVARSELLFYVDSYSKLTENTKLMLI